MDDDHGEGRVRLDVEDEEGRLQRIQTTLERLNAATSSASSSPGFSLPAARSMPCYVPPPTGLLSRVTAFLPALEASNTLLEHQASRDPSSVDIEHVDADMGQYIEMNLGLGVFETRTKDTTMSTSTSPTHSGSSPASTFSSTSSYSTSTDTTSSDSDTSDGSGSDLDSDSSAEIITSFSPVRPIKPLPRRSWAGRQLRPQIVVLDRSLSRGGGEVHDRDRDHGMGEGG